MTDWVAITRRNARSVQTTIGWIFWDPGAVDRLAAIGLPHPFGYIAARAAPLGPAGAGAIGAAFGSISSLGVHMACQLVQEHTTFVAAGEARDLAVLDGLAEHAPEIQVPLAELGAVLWPVVDALPAAGRVLFAAHRDRPRPEHPVLSGWHAVNAVREWRGDTHWAVVTAAGIDGVEASILHNAWMGYERHWLATSRGSTPEEISSACGSLGARGLVADGGVTDAGLALRQRIEDDTDRLTSTPWEMLGEETARWFADAFEPPCELLLQRVDLTAGPNYQPASRVR